MVYCTISKTSLYITITISNYVLSPWRERGKERERERERERDEREIFAFGNPLHKNGKGTAVIRNVHVCVHVYIHVCMCLIA